MDLPNILWIAGIASIFYASIIEWLLHKYVMHRPVGRFRYAFNAHAIVHHGIFKCDETYHLQDEKDRRTIHMAWWNPIVIIAISLLPVIPVAFMTSWWILLIVAAVMGAYYGAYEYFHHCMHLPKKRQFEMRWWFRRINGHHLLHHRYMHKNYNVVLPIADMLLGTLMLRSKINFKQASEPAPNVQPRSKTAKATNSG